MMEKRMNRVESQTARTFADISSIDKRLTKIEMQAVQIKYLAIGALGFYIISSVGLIEFIKAM